MEGYEAFDVDDLYARLLSGGSLSSDERGWLVACVSLWMMTTELERSAYLDRHLMAAGPVPMLSHRRH